MKYAPEFQTVRQLRHAGHMTALGLAIALAHAPLPAQSPREPAHQPLATDSASPAIALTQYTIDTWTTEHGLPSKQITAVLQTRDGYLWIATFDGLARFDGVRFTSYKRADVPALRTDSYWALCEDATGALWAGTHGGGVVRFKHGVFTSFTIADGLPSDFVRSCAAQPDGGMWFGTQKGIVRFSNGRFTNAYPSGPPLDATALLYTRGDALWIGTRDNRLLTLEHGKFVEHTTAEGLPNSQTFSLLEDRDGTIWLGFFGAPLTRYRDGRFSPVPVRGTLSQHVQWMVEDEGGAKWLAGEDGLFRLLDGVASSRLHSQGMPVDEITSLAFDHEGSLWVGTWGGGLARLRIGKFTTITTAEGMANDVANNVTQDRDGTVWIGTQGGLHRYRDGEFTVFSVASGHLPNNEVRDVIRDRKGTLWIATYGGLVSYRNGRFTTYTRRDGLAGDQVRALLEERHGDLLIGTREGLSRLHDGEFTSVTLANGSPVGLVRALYEDRLGQTWISTLSNGLLRLVNGELTSFTKASGLASDAVNRIYEDGDGTLWIGTDGGLTRLRNGRFFTYTAATGLGSDVILQVLEDDQGFLWMPSNRGVLRVRKEQLDQLASGLVGRVDSEVFGEADGLGSFTLSKSMKARDGALWLPTDAGIAIVHPSRITRNNYLPPVYIEEVVADGRPLALRDGKLALAPETRRLELRFSALSLLVPKKVQVRYRLEGFDTDWIEAGLRREAFYTNLPPGHYTFRVIASNNDGLWNSDGARLSFELRSHFWQTSWFVGAVVLLLLMLGAGVVRLRLHVLRRRMVAAIERAETLEALHGSQERFRALYEDVPSMYFTIDEAGTVISVNSFGASQLGYTPDALLGESLFPLFHPDDRAAARSELDRCLADRAHAHQWQIRKVRKDGSVVWVEEFAKALPGVGGATQVLIASRDITERRRLEVELFQSQKLEGIGRLAGGIAHDFNNLLTAILGFAELGATALEPDHPVRPDLEEISLAARRAAELTAQLLAFARQQIVEPKILDLNQILLGTDKMLQRLIGEDVELVTLPGPELWPVRIDAGQFEHVLVNLAVNARDAMPDGGKLIIETENVVLDGATTRRQSEVPEGAYVMLSVCDQGTGMSADTMSHVFEPFFTTKAQGRGTGLGLATVYGTVKQAGGHITVESERGRGTTFRLYFARQNAALDVAASTPATAPASFGGHETILLVEDEPLVRSLAVRTLREQGYTVLPADTGVAGVKLAHLFEGKIDLLVTDVIMPQMGGTQLAAELSALRPGLRVLFMSGYAEDAVAHHGLVDEGIAFLGKPFTPQGLARRVREMLDQPEPLHHGAIGAGVPIP